MAVYPDPGFVKLDTGNTGILPYQSLRHCVPAPDSFWVIEDGSAVSGRVDSIPATRVETAQADPADVTGREVHGSDPRLNEYEVRAVLQARRMHNGSWEYYVAWQHYDTPTWDTLTEAGDWVQEMMSIARASAQEQAMSASTEDDEVEPPVTDPVLPEEIIVKPPDCPAAESDSSVAELGPLAVRLHPDTRETEYQLVRSRQGGRGGPRTSWVRAADKGLSNDEIRRIRAYHAQRWELSPADLRLLASVDVMDLFALFDVPMMNELACCA